MKIFANTKYTIQFRFVTFVFKCSNIHYLLYKRHMNIFTSEEILKRNFRKSRLL